MFSHRRCQRSFIKPATPSCALLALLLLSLAGGAYAAPSPSPQHSQASQTAKPATGTQPALHTPAPVDIDSMTRDGSQPSSAENGDPGSSLGAQSMNVGGAIVRTLLSLAVVLAIAAGAIKYLKKRGYGVAPAEQGAIPAAKPQFGVSPFAQLLQRGIARPSAPVTAAPAFVAGGIGEFEVLGSQSLPGSSHTLYKVRVGERVLLLGGTPSGALNVLTEWDMETKPETDRQFEDMLDRMEREHRGDSAAGSTTSSASLQSATLRLNEAIRRVSSLGASEEEAG